MYLTSASTLGRSFTLYSETVLCLLYVVWCSSNSLVSFRAERHIIGSYFSLQNVRVGLPPGDNSITSFLVNKTVQSTLHMGTTPTSVLEKYGMMYPVIGKSSASCGIGSLAVSDNLSTFPVAVPTLIYVALMLGGTCGSDEAMLKWVSPESTKWEDSLSRRCRCDWDGGYITRGGNTA